MLQRMQAPLAHLPAGKAPLLVPVRLFFDSERLPTNASRSLVRTEEAPVRDVLQLIDGLLTELVAAAAKRVLDPDQEADYRGRLRSALLRLAGCFLRGRWRGARSHLPTVFAPILGLPLLQDAIGRPRSLESFGAIGPALVHTSRRPVEEELVDSLGDVLWVPPGDAAMHLLDADTPTGTRRAVKAARKQLEARQRFLRHQVRAPEIEPSDRQLLSLRFGPGYKRPKTKLPGKLWSDTLGVGEVCLLDPRGLGGKRAGVGRITLLLEGRPISEATVEASWPYEAVISSEHFVAAPGYDGLVHDATFTAAIQAAQASALLAIEELAGVLLAPERDLAKAVRLRIDPERLLERAPRFSVLFRAAQLAHVAAADALSTAKLRGYFREGPLGRLPVWTLHDAKGRREVGLRDLHRTFGSRTLLRMPHDTEAAPPTGREAILVGARDEPLLPILLRDVRMAEYAPRRRADWKRNLRGSWSPIRLSWVDGEWRRGCTGWSRADASSVTWMHLGHPVGQADLVEATLHPVHVWVDEDRLVPSKDWDEVVVAPPQDLDLAKLEWKLVCAVIDHLSGLTVEGLSVHAGSLHRDRALHVELLRAVAAKKGFRRALGKERWQRFAKLPIVPTVDGSGSLDDIAPPRGGIEYLTPEDGIFGIDLGAWNPVRCSAELARVIGRLAGRKTEHAASKVEAMRARARRKRNRDAHQAKPKVSLPSTDDQSLQLADAKVTVSLAAPGTDVLTIVARVGDRPFTEFVRVAGPPLGATVHLGEEDVDPQFAELRNEAIGRVVQQATRAAWRLVLHIARLDPARVVDDPSLRALVLHLSAPKSKGKKKGPKKKANKTLKKLAEELAIFETVQGGRAILHEATTRTRVRVARFEGEWLGPAEGEEAHLLDRPILRLPAEGTAEFITLVERIAAPRTVFRHTRAIRELQSERRVLQGVSVRPTLGYPEETTAHFESLVKDRRSLRGIGYGEIALSPHDDAQLQVVSSISGTSATVPLDLAVPVAAITELPTLAEDAKKGLNSADLARVTKKIRMLGERLLERKVLPNVETLPLGVRRHLRLGLLHHWVEVAKAHRAPLFQTTAGDWVSLDDCQQQAERVGSLWVTTARSYLDSHRVPLDPARFALRLTLGERDALSAFVVVEPAEDELRLDDEARKNKSRAKHGSVALRDAVRRGALHVFTMKSPEGEVAILERGGAGSITGIMLLRDRLPLGIVDSGTDWPVLGKVDEPKLRPTRTWDGAEDDETRRTVLRKIAKKVERALTDMVGDAPADALVSGRLDPKKLEDEFRDGETGRGRFWLTRDRGAGSIQVAGAQAATVIPNHDGKRLPIHGRLLTSARKFRRRNGVHRIAQAAYRTLLPALAQRLLKNQIAEEDRGVALAHLVRGVALGWKPTGSTANLEVPCVVPGPVRLAQLPILFAAPIVPLIHADDPPPRVGFAVCADGSAAAEALAETLGHRLTAPVQPLVAFEDVASEDPPPERTRPSKASKARARKEPKKAAPRVREHALAPLARHLERQLHGLGMAHVVVEVAVARRRKRGLVTYDETTRRIVISGEHPQLIAIQAARLTRKDDAERAMRVLTAHAVGVLNRALTNVTEASELAALNVLLEG